MKLDDWHVLLNRHRLMESCHGEIGSSSRVALDHRQVCLVRCRRPANRSLVVCLYATLPVSDALFPPATVSDLERFLDRQRSDHQSTEHGQRRKRAKQAIERCSKKLICHVVIGAIERVTFV